MTASGPKKNGDIVIGGVSVSPGQRRLVELPFGRLPTQTILNVPVIVINGRRGGPSLWLSAAIHGDELNGIEIIRRVAERVDAAKLRGVILAAPIVNVFGFVQQDRYLPDRRDLNRSFPGSARGALASQLANLFMREVVDRCSYGIDLHTGSHHRTNLPQIRANLDDPEAERCARAFGAPAIIHSALRDGSLREAATQRNKTVLLFEAGEALRFNEEYIRTGVVGVLRVLSALGMRRGRPGGKRAPAIVRRSQWVRARREGMLRLAVNPGDRVRKGANLGLVGDSLGDAQPVKLTAPFDGIVLGVALNPLVHRGEAVVHLGAVDEDTAN